MPLIDRKNTAPGLRVRELNRAGLTELFIAATATDRREVPAMFAAVERVIRDDHAAVVAMDVFGVPPAAVPQFAGRRRATTCTASRSTVAGAARPSPSAAPRRTS